MAQLQLLDSGKMLEVSPEPDSGSRFHAIWLRDNCRCERCGEPSIGRRTLRLSALDLDIRIEKALVETDSAGNHITLNWSDGHEGRFLLDWLMANRYDDEARAFRRFRPVLWDADFIAEPPTFEFNSVQEDENKFLDLLTTVRDRGLVFLSGAPATATTLAPFAEKIGYLQENNFGRIQDLVVDHGKRSIANDVQEL